MVPDSDSFVPPDRSFEEREPIIILVHMMASLQRWDLSIDSKSETATTIGEMRQSKKCYCRSISNLVRSVIGLPLTDSIRKRIERDLLYNIAVISIWTETKATVWGDAAGQNKRRLIFSNIMKIVYCTTQALAAGFEIVQYSNFDDEPGARDKIPTLRFVIASRL